MLRLNSSFPWNQFLEVLSPSLISPEIPSFVFPSASYSNLFRCNSVRQKYIRLGRNQFEDLTFKKYKELYPFSSSSFNSFEYIFIPIEQREHQTDQCETKIKAGPLR